MKFVFFSCSNCTRYFLPVKIVNSTCDIFLLLPAFLFFCCVRVLTKIQERCCFLCFVIITERDVCLSRTLQHIRNMRREKRKKNYKNGKPLKIERMGGMALLVIAVSFELLPQHSSRLSLTSRHPIPPRQGFTRQRCRLRSLWPRVFDSCRKGPQHIVVYHHTHRQGAGKGGLVPSKLESL